eukprot:6322480-Amphidinium_carterae.1
MALLCCGVAFSVRVFMRRTCYPSCETVAAEDDDDFVLVSDLPAQSPSSTSSQSLPSSAAGILLPCAVGAHQRVQAPGLAADCQPEVCVPSPALLAEVCGLPAGDVYIVWAIPGCRGRLSGIHYGRAIWHHFVACIPGGQYRSGLDRLRALPGSANPQESSASRLRRAVQLYQSEASKHLVPRQPSLWLWSQHTEASWRHQHHHEPEPKR